MTILERRDLRGQRVNRQACLTAIAHASNARRGLKLFFSATTDPDTIQPGPAVQEFDRRTIGGAPVLTWGVPSGDKVRFSVSGLDVSLPFDQPETGLFAGLNVGVAIRNGESAAISAEWLAYHQKHQGMNAALIIDRGVSNEFTKDLAELVADMGLARIVVLVPDFPLGRPDLPAEEHPFCAPDAPGKNRMKTPSPDPWRSPLGELSIYELLKERFLSDARAVANIDLSDLIYNSGKNVFDQAVDSSNGVVLLSGRHCYPWRVRKNNPAGFGDHICKQFDASNGLRRWCVAPERVGKDAIWRLVRIVGHTAAPEETIPFMRFMALRHRNSAISKIVPKASLVEDSSLLELATKEFGHKPVRMPELELPQVNASDCKTAIVTTMKNEGPFILEWIAYHRVIGVENFIVYTNDCTDGTDDLLKLLQDKGFVQHRDNPFREMDQKPQHAALTLAGEEPIVQDADWVISMDVDEYLNIKVGDGTLRDLYGHMGDANMIACTWRLFGNSDTHRFTDQPIIGSFDHCAPEVIRKPHQAWGFKTLFRNIGIFKKLGVHRPKGLNPQLWDQIKWVNGSGKPLPRKMFRNAWRSTNSTYGYDVVSLNHYAVRSAESFLVKRDRGRVNHVDRDQGLAYWFRMNNNFERETSIQRMLPKLRAKLESMMKDSEISAAHDRCVSLHRQKIDELKSKNDYSDFYDALTGERMQRLSRMQQHFGANVFLAGPSVIPDEIIFTEQAEDFFFSVERQDAVHS